MLYLEGGNRVWGSIGRAAPDDHMYPLASPASSSMLTIRGVRNLDLDVESSIEYLMDEIGANNVYWANAHNTSFAVSQEDIERSEKDSATWDNPLLSSLPKTRNGSEFSIFCIYGVGKLGERSFFYSTEKVASSGGPASAFATGNNRDRLSRAEDTDILTDEAPGDSEGKSFQYDSTFRLICYLVKASNLTATNDNLFGTTLRH